MVHSDMLPAVLPCRIAVS